MEAASAAPPEGASNSERVRWAFEVINTHDVTPIRSFWTEETEQRFPFATARGEEEIVARFEELFAALPDLHMEVLSVAEQGDEVFAHWRMTATHTGTAWLGIEPTGRPIALDGIDHFTFRDDGTTASNFIAFDQMSYARQIGLLPEDGTVADRGLKTAFNAQVKLRQRLGL